MYTQVWSTMKNAVNDTVIQRDADQAFIPFDDRNRDYREYKKWLDEGNAPSPPPEPPIKASPPSDIHDIERRLAALEQAFAKQR